jgi:hypothetical protein
VALIVVVFVLLMVEVLVLVLMVMVVITNLLSNASLTNGCLLHDSGLSQYF